jgi:hypothetical protein
MGFFKNLSIKSVGNFVSNNVKSTAKDSARIAQQYINNPVTQSLAPLALSSIGVPPEVYGVISNLQNKGLNSLQGIKDEVASGEYSEYSEEIKGLSEEQYQRIVKTIDDEKKQKEEELKKKNRNKIYLLVGGIFLIATTVFVTYKIAKKK